MKLSKKIALSLSLIAAAYGAYAWRTSAPAAVATAEDIAKDPEKKAVAEMAKFLEVAPTQQLSAMHVASAATQSPQPWERLLPFTKETASGVWIAQLLSGGGPLGTLDAAEKNLLDYPERTTEDIQAVLGKLPDNLPNERAELVKFVGEVALHLSDRTPAIALLLKESQRPSEASEGAADAVSQAMALAQYYRLETDHDKRLEAYKNALSAQKDPAVREVLQRYEVLPRRANRQVAEAPSASAVAPQSTPEPQQMSAGAPPIVDAPPVQSDRDPASEPEQPTAEQPQQQPSNSDAAVGTDH